MFGFAKLQTRSNKMVENAVDSLPHRPLLVVEGKFLDNRSTHNDIGLSQRTAFREAIDRSEMMCTTRNSQRAVSWRRRKIFVGVFFCDAKGNYLSACDQAQLGCSDQQHGATSWRQWSHVHSGWWETISNKRLVRNALYFPFRNQNSYFTLPEFSLSPFEAVG